MSRSESRREGEPSDSQPFSPLELELQRVYEENAALLLRYAMAQCRDLEAARDAVQEAFLRYWTARSREQVVEQPRAWLVKVVNHHLTDEVRKMRVRSAYAEKSNEPRVAVQPDAAAEEALNEEIRKLLSPREFECMQQRMAGLTYFEVAEVMAVSPGTVASLMSRAARKLRGLLGGRR